MNSQPISLVEVYRLFCAVTRGLALQLVDELDIVLRPYGFQCAVAGIDIITVWLDREHPSYTDITAKYRDISPADLLPLEQIIVETIPELRGFVVSFYGAPVSREDAGKIRQALVKHFWGTE